MDEVTAAPRWGLGDVAVGLIPVYLNGLALVGSLFSNSDNSTSAVTLWAIVVSSLFTWVFFLGVPVYASVQKGRGLVADFGLAMRATDLLGGFALGVGLQVVVPVLYVPLFWLFKSLDNSDVSHNAKQLTDSAHGLGLVVLVAVLVVGAPIAEEIFFRGLLLRSLERRIGPGWALVVQALVFALAHAEGIELPALIAFGLLAGYLAQRTRRLGPGIGAHMGFNAFTVFALVVLHWG